MKSYLLKMVRNMVLIVLGTIILIALLRYSSSAREVLIPAGIEQPPGLPRQADDPR